MHLIVLVETDTQNAFGPRQEVARERMRLVVERITILDANP